MLPLLLHAVLFLQGITGLTLPGGSVSGELKTENGKPAVGVRVAAMTKPESLNDIANVASFTRLTETDEFGLFRLEDIPPGPYYIVAGRVDLPTFYPGVTNIAGGTIVPVASGATISGINFVMSETSVRTVGPAGLFSLAVPSIPVQVQVENGGKLPVFGPGGSTALRLTAISGGMNVLSPLISNGLSTIIGDYRVTIDNLPEGYSVKSMTYGTADLLSDTLKLRNSTALPANNAPQNVISVTLTAGNSTAPGNGIRVTGRLPIAEARAIYLSGSPGILNSDGTFEFRHVPPGRHTIVAPGERPTSLPMAASIVAGNQDVDGITLSNVPIVPFGFRTAVMPGPSGAHAPGISLPLATLHGHIVEKDTQNPISDGTAYVIGDHWATCPIDAEGRFELRQLIPGPYSIELQLVGYPTIQRTVTVGEDDVTMEFSEP